MRDRYALTGMHTDYEYPTSACKYMTLYTARLFPSGLTQEEAQYRFRKYGPNALPSSHSSGLWHVLRDLNREPIFLLLFAASGIYFFLGEASDALLLLSFVLVALGIVISRQRQTEHVLDALRELSSPRALVMRDGKLKRIPSQELVIGDVFSLQEGDRVAADGRLVYAHSIELDESLLTGESVAVTKAIHDVVFSGSLVVRGDAMAEVIAVGADTAVGKIGHSLNAVESPDSPLQLEIMMMIRRFAAVGLLVSLLVWVLIGVIRHDWIGGLLAGITLAMSILPEEFSVVLMVFMTLGAWRIAKHHVLTRHTSVIEALGAATVLCVDKTGTLTQNSMAVTAIIAGHNRIKFESGVVPHLSPSKIKAVELALMASEIKAIDPMEQAFHRLAHCIMPEFEQQLRNGTLLKEYDMSAMQLAVIHIWRMPTMEHAVVAAKGAPESIMHLCKMRPDRMTRTMKEVQYLAGQGLRVLAVASGKWPLENQTWPDEVMQFEFEWGGLIGLADPLRIGVDAAIAECQAAGVRIVMITGDYPETARAIAKQAGLNTDYVMTGVELDAVCEKDLPLMLKNTQVFARMMPHHKLRLVQTLQEQGEIVAMTGDGVNDAPALKVAHIGISMGQRGSDVAREASSLVLLNDDFSSIVKTMRTGRLIVDNLRKALRYIIGVHLPIAGLALLPLFTGSALILTPSLVMFLEMVINPTSSLVFENEEAEKDLMLKPPRNSTEPFFGSKNILYALLQGLGLLLACMMVFFILNLADYSQEEIRATVFITIVVSNLLMMIVSRSDHEDLLTLLVKPNKYQTWVIGLTVFALMLVLQIPWLSELFNFSRPSLAAVLLAVSACMLTLLWLEIVKAIFVRRHMFNLPHPVY